MKTIQVKKQVDEDAAKEALLDIAKRTNWKQLRNQKMTLILLQSIGVLPHRIDEHLEGLINFLDHIQDVAVDKLGKLKHDVFSLTKDDDSDEEERNEAWSKKEKALKKFILKKITPKTLNQVIREYNEEIHVGSGLTGKDLYDLDESEVDDFHSWCERNNYQDQLSEFNKLYR